MTPDNFFIKYWRILLITFIIFTSPIQELQKFLDYDINMMAINKEACMFVECVVGVLMSSLLLCVFIYLVEKNYQE